MARLVGVVPTASLLRVIADFRLASQRLIAADLSLAVAVQHITSYRFAPTGRARGANAGADASNRDCQPLGFGGLVDRIGPLPTLLLSSTLQAIFPLLFLMLPRAL